MSVTLRPFERSVSIVSATNSASPRSSSETERRRRSPISFFVQRRLSFWSAFFEITLRAASRIVFVEHYHFCVRPITLEIQDVPEVRASKSVDRLRVIPHDRDIPVLFGEVPHDHVLGVIRVLVFVDVDMEELVLV